MSTPELRGFHVLPQPPPGYIPVAGPYRPGVEDWMLYRAITNIRASGSQWDLVREKAPDKQGGFIGVSIWRAAVSPSAQTNAPDGAPSTPKKPSSESSPSSPPVVSSRKPAKPQASTQTLSSTGTTKSPTFPI